MATIEEKQKAGDSIGRKIGRGLWNVLTKEVKVEVPAEGKAAPVKQEPITAAPSAESSKTGVVDDGLVEKLWKVIEEHDLEGFDFIEFNRILSANTSIRTVDKYNAAFSVMKALDTKNKDHKSTLLSSAKHYLEVLNKEKQAFELDFQTLVEERVGSKRKQHELVSAEVAELEQQRQVLEQKIKDKQVVLAETEDEISKQDIELQRQRKNFLSTMDAVTSDIQTKIDDINQYVKSEKAPETTQQ